MPTVDIRPGRLDVFVHPGSPAAIRFLAYPDVAGRTFEGRSGARVFPAAIDGADLLVTLSAADTTALAGRHAWTLVETTGADDVVRVRGDLVVEETTTAEQTTSVAVTAEEVAVTVTLTEPGPAAAGATPEQIQDAVGAMVVDSPTVNFTYDDTAGTLTATVTGLTSADLSDFAEAVRDRLGATLVAGAGISVVVDDPGDTVTITAEVTQAELDALAGTILTTEQVQDVVGGLLADSSVIDVTYDDAGNVEDFTVKPGSITEAMLAFSVATQAELDAVAALATAEAIQDAIGAALTDTATLDLVYDDAAGQIKGNVLDSPTVGGATPAQLRDRATHTGTQAAATISDFTEAAQDAVGGALVDSATVDFTYDDAAGTVTAIVKDNSLGSGKLSFDPATQAELDAEAAARAAADALLVPQASMKVIRKTAEESVTSSVALQADDLLTFAVANGEAWVLLLALFVEGATTGDAKFGIDAPGGSTVSIGLHGLIQSAGTSTGQIETDAVTGIGSVVNVGVVGAGDGTLVLLAARVIAGGAGNVTLQWAQRIADATPTKIQAGSFLLALKAA